jgi:peptidoglycan/xylan/chitin deacetylase (PgdA/CDA1 family)
MATRIEQVTAGVMAMTVNVHGNAVELRSVTEERLVGRYSHGNYMPNGIDRLLRLFSDHGIRATFFVPGREAEMHPDLIREIAAEGHEIAANGYALEDHSVLGDDEPDVLRRAHDTLAACVGVAPQGWRAPDGMMSAATLTHLAAMGYLYDSSFQDDDHPYLLDADGGAGMVEVPQNQILLDQTLFSVRQPDLRVLKNWREEFDALRAAQAFACMTVHPRQDYGVGRAPRMRILDDFLHAARQGPVPTRFMTCAELARAVSQA